MAICAETGARLHVGVSAATEMFGDKCQQNKVSSEIFGSNRDRVTKYWRKLHNEELPFTYYSSGTSSVIKSRMMNWADVKHAETRNRENHMTDRVISNDTRWQNVIFYKCCYH
jgi:hypothetical protein